MMAALARPHLIGARGAAGPALAIGFLAVGCAAAAWKAPDPHRLFLGLGYLGILAFIAAHDTRHRTAPNRVVYPALAAAVLASLTLGRSDALEAWLGGAASFAVLLVVAIAGRGAMGAGDVKVGALCGLAVGLHGVIPLLLVAFVAGALAAAPLLLFRIRRRNDTVAFTPFLVVATIVCMAFFRLYLWG